MLQCRIKGCQGKMAPSKFSDDGSLTLPEADLRRVTTEMLAAIGKRSVLFVHWNLGRGKARHDSVSPSFIQHGSICLFVGPFMHQSINQSANLQPAFHLAQDQQKKIKKSNDVSTPRAKIPPQKVYHPIPSHTIYQTHPSVHISVLGTNHLRL